MTTTQPTACAVERPPSADQSGQTLLARLAAQDFAGVAATLADTVILTALLPRGLVQWEGPQAVEAAFTRWFGDAIDFVVLDADAGEIGARLHLRWRIRITAERLGPAPRIVEQQVYADTDARGLITAMSLLCSGYCQEQSRIG
jgi:hypothetical protein